MTTGQVERLEPGQLPSPTEPAGRVEAVLALAHAGVSRKQVGGSAVYTVGSRLFAQGLQLGTFIALAHFLTPDAFGLVAIVATLSTFAQLFTDLGLGSSILQVERVDRSDLAAGMTINAITGFGISASVVLLRHQIAGLFGKPALVPLLVVAAVSFSTSMNVVHLALLERAFLFKKIAVIESVSAASGVAVSIGCGISGVGSMSLVIGPLTSITLQTVICWCVLPISPFAPGQAAAMGRLWQLCKSLAAFNIVNYWSRNADNLLLGRYDTAVDLGFYARAYQIMMAPVSQVSLAIGRIIVPSIARHKDEPVAAGRLYRDMLRMISLSCFVFVILIAGVAPSLVRVLLGRQWDGMVPILIVLALSGPGQLISTTSGAVYQAMRQTGTLFRRGLFLSVCTVVAFVAGLPWGGEGVAIAFLIRIYVFFPFTMKIPLQLTGLRLKDVLWDIRAPIAGSCVAFAASMAVQQLRVDDAIRLALGLLAGAIAYFAVVAALDAPLIAQAARLAPQRLSRRRRSP